MHWDMRAVPWEDKPPVPVLTHFKYVRPDGSDPGEVFWVPKGGNPLTWEPEPIDPRKPYSVSMSDTHFKIYRPPREAPESKAYAVFSIEYFAPYMQNGEPTWRGRNAEVHKRIVARRAPMEFGTFVPGTFPLMQEASRADVAAGGSFIGELRTFPYPADGVQLQYRLSRPDGYSGDLGELAVRPHSFADACTYFPASKAPHPHSLLFTGSWDIAYAAPKDIELPVYIVAHFSIFDPWAKETRELPFIFRVAPAK